MSSKPNKIALAQPDFDNRELEAVRKVLESGWVVQGPHVATFEQNVAELHRVKHGIAVSSGTAALHICYLALGIGNGDAVFIPSFAWPSAANMAVRVGARPVFVDINPQTYNIDLQSLRNQIVKCQKKKWGIPKAVIPVHEFGLAADMDEIKQVAEEFNLTVIEDAACALGATYHGKPVGNYSRMAIFSFHPRKAITMGDGGIIVTNDDKLAELCRMWRNHGQAVIDGQRDFALAGMNYRMTDIQAAIGQVQLDKFPAILRKREEIARYYLKHLKPEENYILPETSPEHTWQTFMIVLNDHLQRSAVVQQLSDMGVESGPGSMSGHCLKVYHDSFGYLDDDLPVSQRLHHQGLALPVHSLMNESDCERVVYAIEKVMRTSSIGVG